MGRGIPRAGCAAIRTSSCSIRTPYARAVEGGVDWSEACFPYHFGDPRSRNDDDSAAHVPKCIVADPYFDWSRDHPPDTPLHETVIYETHVKGFTMRHPGIPQGLRGKYAGLAHPAAIEHLKSLGVTAVELMPVHQFVHDAHLLERKLRNYWGYNSIEISWYDWEAAENSGGLLEFTRRLIALRAEHPVFRRRRWFQGRPVRGTPDIGWFRPNASEMTEQDWATAHAKSVAVLLNGQAIASPDARGQRTVDANFLILFNAHSEPLDWVLPVREGGLWRVVLDTDAGGFVETDVFVLGGTMSVAERAVVVLMQPRAEATG